METKKDTAPGPEKDHTKNSERNKKFKATFFDLLDEKSRERLERMKNSLPGAKSNDNGNG